MLAILLLLFLYILFCFMDSAFQKINLSKLKADAEEGLKKAVLLQRIVEAPQTFLVSLQLAIVLLFMGIVVAGVLQVIPGAFYGVAPGVLALKALGIVVVFVPANMFCRVLAQRYATRLAYDLIGFVNLFAQLTYPLAKPLSMLSGLAGRAAVGMLKREEDEIKEEIIMMVDAGSETGVLDEREHKMIHSVFKFDTRTAEDVSVHRTHISALPIQATSEEVVAFLAEEQFTRVPVYSENLDDIQGILHAKDVLNHMFATRNLEDLRLEEMLREPYFVPFSKKVDELFVEMKKKQVHMVIVVDEYGGTVGLVTMEDIVEEVMGSILDEHDEQETPDIQKLSETAFIVNGITELETVAEFFGCSLPTDDYETIGGFIIGQLGRIPEDGERPEINYEGLVLKVTELDEKRISKVIARRKNEEPTAGED